VTATGGAYLQSHIADVTVTNMEFRPAYARIFSSVGCTHTKKQRLVVVGSERMAVFDDVRKDDS